MKLHRFMIPARTLLFASVAAAALLLAGCRSSTPPATPISQLTPLQMQGRQLFVQHCSMCHRADSTQSLHGPGLKGVFRNKYLPSGLPATDERVTSEIEYGRDMMPPFGNQLSNQQIQAIVAYLHTL